MAQPTDLPVGVIDAELIRSATRTSSNSLGQRAAIPLGTVWLSPSPSPPAPAAPCAASAGAAVQGKGVHPDRATGPRTGEILAVGAPGVLEISPLAAGQPSCFAFIMLSVSRPLAAADNIQG